MITNIFFPCFIARIKIVFITLQALMVFVRSVKRFWRSSLCLAGRALFHHGFIHVLGDAVGFK